MPSEKKFEVKFTVKDEASQKINSFRQNIKALNTETKYHLRPLMQLRSAWVQVGLAWSFVATTGAVTMSKLALMREEIKKLDELAIKLGVSSEEVSRKMYGFNIASDKARLGAGQWHSLFDNIGKGFAWLGTKTNEATSDLAVLNRADILKTRAGDYSTENKKWWDLARKQLLKEQRNQLESSPDALNLKAEVLKKTRQLSMPERDYKDYESGQELERDFVRGVNPAVIEEYRRAYNKRRNTEENKEYNKLLADRYRAEGDTLEAIKREQDNALDDYIMKWGKNSAMVENFKAGQKAILENAKLTMLGLKNNTQIWQDAQREAIAGMSTTWENFFSDFFNRDLKKGSEYFRMFGQQILKTWSKMLAEMVTNYLATQAQMAASSGAAGSGGKMSWINILGKVAGLAGGFGGGGQTANIAGMGRVPVAPPDYYLSSAARIMHSGGPIWQRAHDGLAVDEVPIIARRGEYVLSEKGVAAAGGIGNVDRINRGESIGGQIVVNFNITAMDALSFKEQLLKHPEVYESVVNNAILRKHAIKRTIKKYASN